MVQAEKPSYTEQQLKTLQALAKAQGKTVEEVERDLLIQGLDRLIGRLKVVQLPPRRRDGGQGEAL